MHRALLISEVLDRIVGHLVGDTTWHRTLAQDFGRADRRALTALARTCHAFSEPALNRVWCKLNSLKPLLLCSSTASLESFDDVAEDTELFPFNEEQWEIVLRYTPRVRDLAIEYDGLSAKILRSLWYHTRRPLPNLRRLTLHWVSSGATSLSLVRSLLGPSLVHLGMGNDGVLPISFLPFFESYYTLCPNLKSLNLHCQPSTPELAAVVSRAICASKNLEALGCFDINEAAFTHVILSRYLQELSCSLLAHSPDDLNRLATYRTPEHLPFENVRILELYIRDLSTIIPFLRSECQPFESVTFRLRSVPTTKVVHEFFVALSSTTRRKTLRKISFYMNYLMLLGEGYAPSQPVDLQVLSPLMNLNLHCFSFNIWNAVSLNDDEIVRLVQAWPELNMLYLNEHNGWHCPPSVQIPTLRGLVLILARCPKLSRLKLSLDATSVPSLSGAESLIRSTTVTELAVANSPIQEPVANVARFLHEHLPSLRAVGVCASISGRRDYYRMWNRVDRKIREIIERPPTPEYNDMI